MDELLILVPVKIHFPLQSIGLKTLDHFMGNHFFYNYVIFDSLLSVKPPVSRVAERGFNRLREKTPISGPSIIHAMKRLWSLCTHTFTFQYLHTFPPISNREGRENIQVNKFFTLSLLKNSQTTVIFPINCYHAAYQRSIRLVFEAITFLWCSVL